MNKSIVILALSVGLTACGGGDSQETKAPAVATVSSLADTSKATGLSAVKVDEQFNLSTKYSLELDVDLGLGDVRAYLNVCQKKVSEQRADYDNCIYRGPLSNSILETQLVLSRQDIELIAEIWFYDTSTAPLLYAWQYESTAEQQQFIMR